MPHQHNLANDLVHHGYNTTVSRRVSRGLLKKELQDRVLQVPRQTLFKTTNYDSDPAGNVDYEVQTPAIITGEKEQGCIYIFIYIYICASGYKESKSFKILPQESR